MVWYIFLLSEILKLNVINEKNLYYEIIIA